MDAADQLRPPDDLVGLVCPETVPFTATGQAWVRFFKDLCDLQPHEQVLDVGCGPGRVAIPLTAYLTHEGGYEGFDPMPKAVHWCKEHISSKYPNFTFRVIDIFNKCYNPTGQVPPRTFQFPYADEQFDFVFLGSVFTHMLPDDVEHYCSEIARVLRRGGRLLTTFFLLNEESLQLIRAGKSDPQLPHDFGVYRAGRRDVPEEVVAYSEDYVLHLYRRFALGVRQPIYYGTWRSAGERTREYQDFQDFVIADRL